MLGALNVKGEGGGGEKLRQRSSSINHIAYTVCFRFETAMEYISQV